jgi:signal transduction histidine kinase
MDSKKEALLNETHKNFLNSLLMKFPKERVGELVVEDVMGYGTTIDEKIQSVKGLQEIIQRQIDKGVELTFDYEIKEVHRRYNENDNIGIFVNELKLTLNSGEGKNELNVRLSSILEYFDPKWKVIHWHGSIATDSENDTWHLQEWKKKQEELERLVAEKTAELNSSLQKLKAAQEQLIQQEKLASLGQLTAGIAHEIKNPLNFVNNFSELSIELLEEVSVEFESIDDSAAKDEIIDILEDVKSNLEKINQHGTRADGVVKSMLLHSRGGSGSMEPTNLNSLLKEYVNLAFHGMRASKKAINVKIDLDLDDSIDKISINSEDFSRLVLNFCKNAFDAMQEKIVTQEIKDYLPNLKVTSRLLDNEVLLAFEDNGPGIPDEIKSKILLPFFTTKKGNDGTGLGLSLTNDIIKAHGGTLNIISDINKFTRFEVLIPSTHN